MPEGPEVRIIINQLNSLIKGQKLHAINIHSGRYSKKAPSGFLNFREFLPIKLEKVKCKGKFIERTEIRDCLQEPKRYLCKSYLQNLLRKF